MGIPCPKCQEKTISIYFRPPIISLWQERLLMCKILGQDLGDISYVICEFDEDISGELFQNEYEIKQ